MYYIKYKDYINVIIDFFYFLLFNKIILLSNESLKKNK